MGQAGDDDTVPHLMLIAERVLTASFGGMVRLGPATPLDASPGSTVYRCTVHEAPHGVPASVIVKSIGGTGAAYDPDAVGGPAASLFNEWAGLAFLHQLAGDDSPAARFYGGDRVAGLVVLEDLGEAGHLHQLLLGDDPAIAEGALVELATTLGRMHAMTIGQGDRYHRLRGGLGPVDPKAASYSWLAPRFQTMAAVLGMAVRPDAADDLETLRAVLRDPGPFLAYTHGDACPDNCVRAGDTVRLFDVEGVAPRHALIDGVFGRMHFPSCWCAGRLPAHIPPRLEDAYRAALVRGCPAAAADALFQRAVVEACIYWLIRFDHWYPLATILERDEEWDMATIRQRLLFRFGIVARTVREVDHLGALGGMIVEMDTRLRSLWAPATEPMPCYPAFRSLEGTSDA